MIIDFNKCVEFILKGSIAFQALYIMVSVSGLIQGNIVTSLLLLSVSMILYVGLDFK